MKNKFLIIFLFMISFFAFSVDIEDCKQQVKEDEQTCRELKPSGNGRNVSFCWEQVRERYSYCIRNKEIGWPNLYLKTFKLLI